jgi:hypothetical protein
MLTLSKASKIYIECTAYKATGGTEALHQLAHGLRSLGYESFMFYLDVDEDRTDRKDPTNEKFKKYIQKQ